MGSRREATGAFDDIIPDLYDALLRPQAWPGVLTRVADAAKIGSVHFLLPHLRRVAQMQHRLATLEASASPLSGALDRLASGVVIIDQGFRVRFVNRVAEDILRAGSGLLLCNHRLLASDTDVSKRLDRLIAEAAQCAAGGDPHKGGGGLAVPRPSGRRPVLLVVWPLPGVSCRPLSRAGPRGAA